MYFSYISHTSYTSCCFNIDYACQGLVCDVTAPCKVRSYFVADGSSKYAFRPPFAAHRLAFPDGVATADTDPIRARPSAAPAQPARHLPLERQRRRHLL